MREERRKGLISWVPCASVSRRRESSIPKARQKYHEERNGRPISPMNTDAKVNKLLADSIQQHKNSYTLWSTGI